MYYKNLLIPLFLLTSSVMAQVQFAAGVGQTSYALSQKIHLQVVITGKVATAPPKLSLENLVAIEEQPQKLLRTEWINRQKQTLTYYHYTLQAQKLGTAKIVVSYSSSGQQRWEEKIVLQIIKQAPSLPQRIEFWQTPSSYRVFAGEVFQLTSTARFSMAVNVDEFAYQPGNIRGGKIFPYQRSSRYHNINGVLYRELSWTSLVVCHEHGQTSIGGSKATCFLWVPEESDFDQAFGKDEFFEDDFFRKRPLSEKFGGKKEKISLSASSVTIAVLPLPTPNQPRSFYGAVGKFSIFAPPITQTVREGEVFYRHITLQGEGNIGNTEFAFPSPGTAVERLDEKTTNNSNHHPPVAEAQLHIIQTYRATKSGELAVPGWSWSYFDPGKKSYQTITVPQEKVQVLAARHER